MRPLFCILLLAFLGPVRAQEPPRPAVPDSIIAKADVFIISSVGSEFFKKYIKFDKLSSHFEVPDSAILAHPTNCAKYLQYPYYYMIYKLDMPEKNWVKSTISFVLDTLGNIIPEALETGIPDGVHHPEELDFSIDEKAARDIARKAGLEDGIQPWHASFQWSRNTYIWYICNTLSATRYGSTGKGIAINANSGEVLNKINWDSTP